MNVKKWLMVGVLSLAFLCGSFYYQAKSFSGHVLPFKYTSQLYPLYAPDACEAASLKMALSVKHRALHISLKTVIDRMPKAKSNPNLGFTGSPYHVSSANNIGTIYPKPLARYARTYGVKAVNISGASLSKLVYAIEHNNPVIFVGAWRMKTSNSYHVPVLMGYRPGYFLIADPYMRIDAPNKTYWVSTHHFMKIFRSSMRHQRAVEIE